MVVKIDDFSKLKYLDYGKVFLVLYFKKFTWKKELQKEFGISSEVITNAIKILKHWDLVNEVDFDSLGISDKKNFWNLNSSYYDLLKSKPKVYKITTKSSEGQGYFLFESLKKEAKTNENLSNFIRHLIRKTETDVKGKNSDKIEIDVDVDLKSDVGRSEDDSEFEIDMEEIEYFKVFLVLYMKGFSWKKELENDFNISKSVVLKSIELLERRGFIIA